MKALVIYESTFGNTERVARAIGEKLGAGIPVEVVAAGRGLLDIRGVDLLVVGGPTQGHGAGPAARKLLEELEPEAVRGVLVAAFDTRLNWAKWLSGSAAAVIARRLEEKGGKMIAPPESFIVSGKKGPLADGELERAGIWVTGLGAKVGELIQTSRENRKTA